MVYPSFKTPPNQLFIGKTELRKAVVLSAAFDGKVGLIDVRQPKQAALAALLGFLKEQQLVEHNGPLNNCKTH